MATAKAKQTVEKVVEAEVLDTFEVQLGIFEEKVIAVPTEAKRVVAEVMYGGDTFIDIVRPDMSVDKYVAPGESKEFKDVLALILVSASRPVVRITIFK